MLSICIPIYNSDATALVNALLTQMKIISYKVELIVIDDASDKFIWKFIDNEADHSDFKLIRLKQNIGRSKIRNYFLRLAKHPFLLFIDGDSSICSNNFIQKYIDALQSRNISVLCGASIYQKEPPSRSKYLRWKYSIEKESKSTNIRISTMHIGFKTNNFIIRKSLFEKINFEETLNGYGHEDTLFGYQLEQLNVTIEHIDNPVLNKELDTNEVFLNKTTNAVRNLCKVLEILAYDEKFIKQNKLCKTYFVLKKYRFVHLASIFFFFFHPLNRWLLVRGIFFLPMFDLFKLKYMILYCDQKKASRITE